MAVSGINNYRDAMYTWQAQQLKATGAAQSSSASSSAVNALLGGNVSMTSQVSSMVELTKYAMDQMGVSSDARVTFNQISKYREQLQSEFNEGVRKGIEASGIANVNALSFSIDKNGVLSAIGDNAADRKLAQSWLDANPAFGQSILKNLPAEALTAGDIAFTITSTGHITASNRTQTAIQSALNQNAEIADKARAGLAEAGIEVAYPLEFKFDDNGSLVATGENSEALNAWLAGNAELAETVKKELAKHNVDPSAVTLRLGANGAVQTSVNDAAINEIQEGLDKSQDTGAKIIQALGNLGIDKNINFSLQVDENGAIKVISDHPDAAKMQKFFDENPDLVKKYRQIETLAGIDDARKAMQISPSAMRKRIQIESMAAWWAGSSDATSYFGGYSSDGLSLMSGLNLSV